LIYLAFGKLIIHRNTAVAAINVVVASNRIYFSKVNDEIINYLMVFTHHNWHVDVIFVYELIKGIVP
jgi:hypothetical protein